MCSWKAGRILPEVGQCQALYGARPGPLLSLWCPCVSELVMPYLVNLSPTSLRLKNRQSSKKKKTLFSRVYFCTGTQGFAERAQERFLSLLSPWARQLQSQMWWPYRGMWCGQANLFLKQKLILQVGLVEKLPRAPLSMSICPLSNPILDFFKSPRICFQGLL